MRLPTAAAAAALVALTLPLAAQESEAKREAASRFPEAEYAASSIFRSATYLQPLWKGLHFEGHYFGEGETDVGYSGAGWKVRWKGLGLVPGFGVAFGSNEIHTTPVVSFRWDYEKKWFVTQGMVLQGLRQSPGGEAEGVEEGEEAGYGNRAESAPLRPSISDGNHVSVRWNRVTVGPTWEHVHFREGNEWKGGGRLAVRLMSHVSAVLYVLAPGKTEFRLGVLVHPAAPAE